jgi:Rap1a immunity proteins
MPEAGRPLPLIVAGALLLASVTNAPAQEGYSLDDFDVESGQDLLDVCGLDEGHAHYWEAQAFCFGYFHGGADFHHAMIGQRQNPIVCPPPEVTVRDAVDQFVSYARAHPEYLGEEPMDLVFRAVIEAWPCP